MPRFSLTDLSLKHRLPLLIGALLLSLAAASTWLAYRSVKESAREVGRERLTILTQQLATMMQQQAASLMNKTFAAANDQEITNYLGKPTAGGAPNAVSILDQFTGSHDPNSLQVELWDANRSIALVTPQGSTPLHSDLSVEFDHAAADPFQVTGAFRIVNGSVVYPIVAAVNGGDRPLGYLVRWRRLAATPDSRKQLNELLGPNASIFFGNIDGKVWTDTLTSVSKPPGGLPTTLQIAQYRRDGESVMALGRPVSGTPWFIVVEFADHVFLGQAKRFLKNMGWAALVLLTLAVVGAIVLSLSITRPLGSLTTAATAISRGDYSAVVDIPQRDELGTLAGAFNVMVAKVLLSQSELEQKVQALRESEQRLQTVIENLGDGLIISDMNGKFVNWNKAAVELHSLDGANEIPSDPAEFGKLFELTAMDGSILPVEQWPLQRVIKEGKLIDLEVRVRRLNADWQRIFSYSGNVVREENGRLIAFVTITDITLRKQNEEERCVLASIVESSRDAIIGKDLDGRITSWNAGAEKLYGYSPEEVLGQSVSILFPPPLCNQLPRILASLAEQESLSFETERVNKSGKQLFVSLNISPIRSASRRITGWSTIARDITERKQIEEALSVSEVHYRRLFESARDGVLIMNTYGKIADVNPYLLEKLSYSKEELLGKQLWEIGSFKDIAASKAAFQELQAQDYVRYDDLPLESSDGKLIHVEVVANSYFEGSSRVVQANIRDVSERKLIQDELLMTNTSLAQTLTQLQAKTEELGSMTQQFWQASKLATMGELAASVAHELNNPLATIALHIEMLLTQLVTDDPRRSLLVVEEEVDRMARLVSNLLVFSRRSHRQMSTLDLREELTNTLEFISYHLRSQKVRIVEEFADNIPTVQADRQQLRQVFLNLITNAGDAMPAGGTLRVRCHSGPTTNGRAGVVIEFADTGTGVQTGDLPKLWEPFFTTKPEGKGTGLGLAICRRTVEEHRGSIDIKTGPGEGTTVRIILPATEEHSEVAA